MEFIDNPLELRGYFLNVLEQKIDTLTNFEEEEKAELKLTLDALKELISLDTKDTRILKFFNDLSIFSISIALGNYNVRIEAGDPKDKDLFYSVAIMLNQMAEELEANCIPNNFFTTTLNALPKAAFICDERKRFVHVNEKFLKHTQLEKHEVKGKKMTSLISVVIGKDGNRDKLMLQRKNLPPAEILLRMQPIEASHPLDRPGTLYTLSIVN